MDTALLTDAKQLVAGIAGDIERFGHFKPEKAGRRLPRISGGYPDGCCLLTNPTMVPLDIDEWDSAVQRMAELLGVELGGLVEYSDTTPTDELLRRLREIAAR